MNAAGIAPVHASCVAMNGRAVLIVGESGSGKSALALQLMALGGQLVADDGVLLERDGEAVIARPHGNIAGRIEARGIGILDVPWLHAAEIDLVVDLDKVPSGRLPPDQSVTLAGVECPLISGKGIAGLAAVLAVKLRSA